MKEIKFRVWSNDLNKMVYPDEKGWFQSCFIGENKYYQTCSLGIAIDKNGKELNLMQYTGLKDNNDKEIYEGDIVRYLDGNEWSTESGYDFEEFDNLGKIFFDEECGRYDVTNKQGIGYDDLFDCGVDFEIIGNIYEHPHLLKGDLNE